MANIRKYKNTDEAKQAQREQRARYIETNLVEIKAKLPKEYKPKLEYIAQRMNTSKAQVLKTLIDIKYNELIEAESQQPSPEESDT
ncbi:hypothetical protein [Faecalibacterium sp. An121]|uniref:hypothetical protein n=1 Tax=Faecalibacterium sp. An121 TaxID=1965550 RepID=UPI00117A6FCD|nr:hypothetical protein [Faecalibacterium sp. An121]